MGRKSLTLVSCKYLHNRRLEISSQTGRESVISMLFSVLYVYMCCSIQAYAQRPYITGEDPHVRVCVFFVFFLCVFLGGVKCIFACAHVWMFVFMHVDACSSWESNLKLDPAGRLSW